MADLRHAREILEGMEGRLPRVAQYMAVLAAIERYADEAVHGRADPAHRIHLLIDNVGRHVASLKQIPVEPPEVTVDPFGLLDLFDAVDGSGLAVAEKLRRFLPLDLHHLADEIVAQRREMGGSARGHAAGNRTSVDHHHGHA